MKRMLTIAVMVMVLAVTAGPVMAEKVVTPLGDYGYTFDSVIGSEEDYPGWNNGTPIDTEVGWDAGRKVSLPDTYPALMLERQAHWSAMTPTWPSNVQFKTLVACPNDVFGYILTTGTGLYTFNYATRAVTRVGEFPRQMNDICFYDTNYAVAVGYDETICKVTPGATPAAASTISVVNGPVAGGNKLRAVDINDLDEALIVGDYYTVIYYEVPTGTISYVNKINSRFCSMEVVIDAVWNMILRADRADADNYLMHTNVHPSMSPAGAWKMYQYGVKANDPYWQVGNMLILAVGMGVGFGAGTLLYAAAGIPGGPVGIVAGAIIGMVVGTASGYIVADAYIDAYDQTRIYEVLGGVFTQGMTDVMWRDDNTADISGEAGLYRYEKLTTVPSRTHEVNDDWLGFQDRDINKRDLWSGPGLIRTQFHAPSDPNYYMTLMVENELTLEHDYIVFNNQGMFKFNPTWNYLTQDFLDGGIVGRDTWDSNDEWEAGYEDVHESMAGKMFLMTSLDRRTSDGKSFGTYVQYGVQNHRVGDVVRFDGSSLVLVNTGSVREVSDFDWARPDGGYGIAIAQNQIMIYTDDAYADYGEWYSPVYLVENPVATIGEVLVSWTEHNTPETSVEVWYSTNGATTWQELTNSVASCPDTDYGTTYYACRHYSLQIKFLLWGDTLDTPFVDAIDITYRIWGPPTVTMHTPRNMVESEYAANPLLYWTNSSIMFKADVGAMDGWDLDPIENMYFAWRVEDPYSPTGQESTVNGSNPSWIHTFLYPGPYTVEFSAGLIARPTIKTTVTQTIYVENRAPVARMTISGRTGYNGNIIEGSRVGTALTWDGSGSYDVDRCGRIYEYMWDWGDGSTSTTSIAAHTWTSVGTYDISLTVTDYGDWGTDGKKSTTVTGQVVVWSDNVPPVPRLTDDEHELQFGDTVTLDASPSTDGAADMQSSTFRDVIVQCSFKVMADDDTVVWRQNRTKAGAGVNFNKFSITPNMTTAGHTYRIFVQVLDNDDASDDGIARPLWSEFQMCGLLIVRWLPLTGDWTITAADGFIQMAGANETMSGSIIVDTGGRLEISGTLLRMDPDRPNVEYIAVNEGGDLSVTNRSVIYATRTPIPPGLAGGGEYTQKYYLFYVRGQLFIDDSTIRSVGMKEALSWYSVVDHYNGITLFQTSTAQISGAVIEENQKAGVSVQSRNIVTISNTGIYHCYDQGVLTMDVGSGTGVFVSAVSNVLIEGCEFSMNEGGVIVNGDIDILNTSIDGKGTGIYATTANLLVYGSKIKATTGVDMRSNTAYHFHANEIVGYAGSDTDTSASTGVRVVSIAQGDFINNSVYNCWHGIRILSGSTDITIIGTDFKANTQTGNSDDISVTLGSRVYVKNYVRALVMLNGAPLAGVTVQFHDAGTQTGSNVTTDARGLTGWVLMWDRTEYGSSITQINNTYSAYHDAHVSITGMGYNGYSSQTLSIILTTFIEDEDTDNGGLTETLRSLADWLPGSWWVRGLMFVVLIGAFTGIVFLVKYKKERFVLPVIVGTAFIEAMIVYWDHGYWWYFTGSAVATALTIYAVVVMAGHAPGPVALFRMIRSSIRSARSGPGVSERLA